MVKRPPFGNEKHGVPDTPEDALLGYSLPPRDFATPYDEHTDIPVEASRPRRQATGCVKCKHGQSSLPVVEAGRLFLVHVPDETLCESAPTRLWLVADRYGWRHTVENICNKSIKIEELVEQLERYRPTSPSDGLATSLAKYILTGRGLEEASRWAVSVTASEVYAASHPVADELVYKALVGMGDALRGAVMSQRESFVDAGDVDLARLELAERVLLLAYEVDADDPLGVAEHILSSGMPQGCVGFCAEWLAPAFVVDMRDVELVDELCSPVRCALLKKYGDKAFSIYNTLVSETAAVLRILAGRAAEPLSPRLLEDALASRIARLRERYGEAYILLFRRTPLKENGLVGEVWEKTINVLREYGSPILTQVSGGVGGVVAGAAGGRG